MAIQGVDTKCYILALFIRDDGERFLLGSGYYEFKDEQMHFSANTIENDTISVQGNDGYLLAGQVRRPGSQEFNGFVGDGTVDKSMVEQKRRDFFSFFRKNFFYKVVYVFPNGTAIQRKRGFLVDDPTVQELYQIYPQYHVALNFEDVNYYSYAEDDDGQEIYAKVAEIQLTASAASGGLIWDNYGVVWEDVDYTWSSAPGGTSFVILNQLDMRAKIKDLVIQGDTYQQTYSGKNLLPTRNIARTINDVTFTPQADGSIIVNGTASAQINYPINVNSSSLAQNIQLESGSYTVSGGRGPSSPIFVQAYYNETGGTTKYSTGTFTITNNANLGAYIRVTNGSTISNEIVYPQLEASSTPTSYEPYVGGTPAPNPDYPQNIDVVTGEQTVRIEGGKNLFKGGNADYTGTSAYYGYGVSTYTVSGGVYTIPQPYGAIAFEYDNLTIGQQYTLSFDVISTVSGACFVGVNRYSGASPTGDNMRIDATTTPQRASFTFTATATNRIAFNSGATASFSVSYSNIQLEKGSTATTYEPYIGTTKTVDLDTLELCKIGTYQDYIYKSGDDWYVHKEIGKAELDGTESWSVVNSGQSSWFYMANIYSKLESMSTPYPFYQWALSDHYTNAYISSNDVQGFNIIAVTNVTNIRIREKTEDTIANFEAWLASNKPSIYAPLATPTDTQITNSTLIGQLDALGSSKLFVGENNVLVSSTGTNLPAPVQFKYVSAYSVTGAEWEEGGPSGPTTVTVDSIAQVFPVWEVKGPAVNPQLSILTTGTTITYNGTITSSQVLSIDMFNKTATLNGTSVVGNVSGDWVCFDPGTNRVVYTTGNADALPSTIKWQEIVG